MAFHFDARGDSSDNEAVVDLNAWKTGELGAISSTARAGASVAPVAPMIPTATSALPAFRKSSTPEAAAFQPSRIRKKNPLSPSASPPAPSYGFKAINESSRRPSGLENTYDRASHVMEQLENSPEVEQVLTGPSKPKTKANGSQKKGLVVRISRRETEHMSDVEDYRRGADRVRQVLRESQEDDGTVLYDVQFDDYHTEEVSFNDLLHCKYGEEAIEEFNANRPPAASAPAVESSGRPRMSTSRPGAGKRQISGFVNTVDNIEGSELDVSEEDTTAARPLRSRKRRKQNTSQYFNVQEFEDDGEESHSEDELQRPTRTSSRRQAQGKDKPAPHGRSLRTRRQYANLTEDEEDVDSDGTPFLQLDLSGARKRKGKSRKSIKVHADPQRVSSRATRHVGGMREVEMDDIYRSDSEPRQPVKPKTVLVREVFKDLPRNNEFRMRHCQHCDICGAGSNLSKLIYCQGCSLSYHKACLGHRTTREHLVTKVNDDEFVLQCRRCVGFPRKKDPSAPDQGKCQECKQHGGACRPFRSRKTSAQEQRDREENDGVDPAYDVPEEKINNVDNVMFRCMQCFRGFHYEHLQSRADYDVVEPEPDPEQRFREYSRDWKCKDCAEMPAKVSGIIAWRPLDEDIYDPASGFGGVEEDEKAYLVRWGGMSYFRAMWMPGPWVWGVTAHSMRKAFAKREDSQHPKMRTEDAIPEDYLRTDIVLDIKFTSYVDIRTEEIDKARIREVDKALIKYKGLSYEDAVWETPPTPIDGDRWTDFVTAYNDWVAGRYVRQPKPAALKTRLEKIRREDFRNLEKTVQPDNLQGGKLMEYQIQGLNWLYYKWFTQKNAILADEMGLGKTIQIIGFLATMVQEHSCYPFLVVVPNSTCPNWRREIKRWAPTLRVVAYYGSRESRELALRHELYPEGAKDLRCHIVVTSYDAAADENCRRFFKGVPWQGLIVDEGQRLKNDKNQLYSALAALKAPFKILVTGTPLQNNQRELFNLLHFIDDSFNPAELEKEYEELDSNKIAQMHEMIRPFFLRRTKAQVLTFLPPMAQIIVPVSMSIVQKKLYRSILAKNPDLMKAIFSAEANSLKQTERASLSNILMQLRKCLCHPFVYNKSIEDRHVDMASSHRNLVDASSKLKLLELLLPKLQERGHRVLIFSQFLEMLDMVEDFMDGMQLKYQRLDGSISAMNKQKRIDEFNEPDSPLFAFLLSTRAGGVGINLATADTVIILDPDFNPHQDIQALSRAHRIGQQKKVLCFQLVTRASAEERIMQIGRRKLALDHVLIQEMDADDAEQTDLVSVLRHGASELFEDSGDQDITYDAVNVERLLDRSHMEDTKAGEDKTAETQFSFARVWANGDATLQDADMETAESAPDPGVWANILKERERIAAEEAAAMAEAFGRGRRARAANVDYTGEGVDAMDITPAKRRKKRDTNEGESDTDFQADDSGDDDEIEGEILEHGELLELDRNGTKEGTGKKKEYPAFKRVVVPAPRPIAPIDPYGAASMSNGISAGTAERPGVNCRACVQHHPVGSCPLKLAGVEFCNLCGMAHYGHARVCPHIQSETQVRAMVEALKYSNEPEHLVNEAKRYLRGLKGSLVQLKKQKEQREMAAREAAYAQQQSTFPSTAYSVPAWNMD